MAIAIRERLVLQRAIKTDIAALKEGGIGVRERLALQRKVKTDIASLKGISREGATVIAKGDSLHDKYKDAESIGFDVETTYIHATNNNDLKEIKGKGNFPGLFVLPKDEAILTNQYGKIKYEFALKEDPWSNEDISNHIYGNEAFADRFIEENTFIDDFDDEDDREEAKERVKEIISGDSLELDDVTEKAFRTDEIDSFKDFQSIRMRYAKDAGASAVVMDDEFGNSTVAILPGDGAIMINKSEEIFESALSDKIDAAANQAATSNDNDLPDPTMAQYESGLYKKGHVRLNGLDIAIENPRGSARSGVDQDGTEWSSTMTDHYGYIKRSIGADGDHVDVYIGPDVESDKVFIIDQIDQKDGSFDEHKCMMGYKSKGQAVKAYKGNFDDGWKVGEVFEVPVSGFKDWVFNGDTKQPFSDSKDLIKESTFY